MEQDKKYGGTAAFFGISAFLCLGLTAYNIYSIRFFIAAEQTISALPVKNSIAQKIADLYVSLFTPVFGNYPPTQVLSVLIPVTISLLIFFLLYLDKATKKTFKPKEAPLYDQSTIQG